MVLVWKKNYVIHVYLIATNFFNFWIKLDKIIYLKLIIKSFNNVIYIYTYIHASNDLPIYNIYKTSKIGLKYIKILLCQTNEKIKTF